MAARAWIEILADDKPRFDSEGDLCIHVIFKAMKYKESMVN
jgi:hypothetical protein